MDNPVKEAIVLAGGLGTRLRDAIGEFPKCLAPVNGKPFLDYVLNYLESQKIQRVILSVGYKHELICEKYGNQFGSLELVYAIEKEPLGTGGAIKLALEKSKSEVLFVLNGDTYFDISLKDLHHFHLEKNANCSIALKKLFHVDRYGMVDLNDEGKVTAFREKEYREETIINGGIYCINKGILIHYPVNTPFSFEKNYLENNPKAKKIAGKIFDNYFIDIGIPEDYKQFEADMSKKGL